MLVSSPQRLPSPHTDPLAPHPTASHHKLPCPIISPVTPLESTFPTPPASVRSKPLTATRFPLESILTKKTQGEGSIIVNQTSDEGCLSRMCVLHPESFYRTTVSETSRVRNHRQQAFGRKPKGHSATRLNLDGLLCRCHSDVRRTKATRIERLESSPDEITGLATSYGDAHSYPPSIISIAGQLAAAFGSLRQGGTIRAAAEGLHEPDGHRFRTALAHQVPASVRQRAGPEAGDRHCRGCTAGQPR
jgi:hypothetical protein